MTSCVTPWLSCWKVLSATVRTTRALDVEDDEGNVTPIAHGQALAEFGKRERQPSSIAG